MGKKEFATIVLDSKYETFIIYIAFFSFTSLIADVHLFRRLEIACLIAKETLTMVSANYVDFADVFWPDLASKLFEHTGINNSAIKLINSQPLLYEPIYSLWLVQLEPLKAYIKINLANRFIRLSQSPTNTLILFDQKSDGFLWLYINYRSFNNLTIKNWYLLLLVGELLGRLRKVRRFI